MPQGTEPESAIRPQREGRGSRRVKGSSPALHSSHLSGFLCLRCSGLAQRPAKRKQAEEADSVRVTAAPPPPSSPRRSCCAARSPRASNPARWLASAPSFPSPPALRPKVMSSRPSCGAGGARRCGQSFPSCQWLDRASGRENARLVRSGVSGPQNLCSQCGASPEDARGASHNRVHVSIQRQNAAQSGTGASPS